MKWTQIRDKNGATVVGKNSAKIKRALIHNCIDKILSAGSVGNKNAVSEKKPLIVKNKAKIIKYLFIDI